MLQVPHSKRDPLGPKCWIQCPLKGTRHLPSEDQDDLSSLRKLGSQQNYPIGLPGKQEMVYVLIVT